MVVTVDPGTTGGKPNFAGTWLNSRTEGDKKKFFKEGLEMRSPMLQIAGCLNYGTNKLTHIIVQDGDQITVTQTWPEKVTTTFNVDGQLHDGKTAEWDGDKLIITPGPDTKSADAFTNTRWMEGDTLVAKFSFASKPGVEITRYFTRKLP